MKSRFLGIIIALTLVLSLMVAFAAPVSAAKPPSNQAGAQKVAWNLSAAVMPVPPYGSLDIPGSNTASKLIVNRPNGNTALTITGPMNGLHPNTEYTVYLSNGYTPYVPTGWDVTGTWVIDYHDVGANLHDMQLIQSGTSLTGSGGYPAGGPSYQYPWTITSGSVIVNTINFTAQYHDCVAPQVNGTSWSFTGTIAADGTISGAWTDNAWGYPRSGALSSTSGNAIKTHTGDSGWPGLFTSTVPAFTFTTDAYGAGSWHVNLTKADFPEGSGTYTLSVWINGSGATILISDNFSVAID